MTIRFERKSARTGISEVGGAMDRTTDVATTRVSDDNRDRLAVQDLLDAYFAAIDSRSWDDLARCFTADARFGMGGRPPSGEGANWVQGREAIVGYIRLVEKFPSSTHARANSVVRIDGDRATAVTRAIAVLIEPQESGATGAQVRGLIYQDELDREGEVWRIGRRVHMPCWQFDATAVPPASLPPPEASNDRRDLDEALG